MASIKMVKAVVGSLSWWRSHTRK